MMNSDLEITIDKFLLVVKGDLRYSKDHVWVKIENEHCILGLTDYAQRKGGDIVFLKFEDRSGLIKEGEPVALYETIKAALNVSAPFNHQILELNSILEDQPELINEDPYGKGWIARVKPENQKSLNALLSPENYLELIKDLEALENNIKDE
jgi:glycine cleavage system H protein